MTSNLNAQKIPAPPEKKVLLPRYVLKEADGVYVNLSLFPVGGGFDKFIERLFSDGFRFDRIDYQLLINLLYYHDSVLDTYGRDAKVKLADALISFPAKRKALYRGVMLDERFQHAEYLFEPVEIEEEIEKPIYGKAEADGTSPIVGMERISEIQPTNLNPDEFIAEMWLKGIRFGIDVDKVASTISSRRMGRVLFAVQQNAIAGNDAEIVEASDVLHQDNSPKILANGKADLSKFQNRFPHIEKGVPLLRKKLGTPGKQGCKVNGERIAPELPTDVDLHALAGDGTRIELVDGEECIVAARSGYLALDLNTNIIEVTEKIENKGGISAKTTGDLSLSGKDYIEHGVVQEGRTVEGMNMTFLADVHGTIVSKNGLVLLEKDLSSGCVESYNGDVTSNGRVLNSIIEVHNKLGENAVGNVTLNYAEACLISGHTVVIKHAVNCEIVAEHVEIGIVEGCSVVAKSVKIASSNVCRRRETNIAILLPDFSKFETKIRQEKKSLEKFEKIIHGKDKEVAKLRSDPEIAKYLTMAAAIIKSGVKLSESQQAGWDKMAGNYKFAKAETALARLTADKQDQLKLVQTSQQEIATLMKCREQSGQSVYCKISGVVGNTLVRIMPDTHEVSGLQKLKANDLKLKLRENGREHDRIFFNDIGSFDWEYKAPAFESAPEISKVTKLSTPVVAGASADQMTTASSKAKDLNSNPINSAAIIESTSPDSDNTTVNTPIPGEDFIEQGIVQEGRIIEGMNMTFLSDVFGTIVSKNGLVLLEKDLSNASIQSFNGDVTLNGRALNSIIEVNDRRGEKAVGNITLNYAETCLISGHTVVIKHAVNCEIVAENVEIGIVEGCSIAAKSVKIASSNVYRRREANIAMLLPDFSEFETKIGQLQKPLEKFEKAIQEKDAEVSKLRSDPEIDKYLTMAAAINKSGVKLSESQQAGWDKIAGKYKLAKADTVFTRLNADKQDQLKQALACRQEIATLIEKRDQSGLSICCKISEVVGNTLVRIMPDTHDVSGLQTLKTNEIKMKLRENGKDQDRIFFNDEGSFDWEYKAPAVELAPEISKVANLNAPVVTGAGINKIATVSNNNEDLNSSPIKSAAKIESTPANSEQTPDNTPLPGIDFIEQGIVPEGRIVEGMNMTFLSDVFGTIISKNGLVLLEKDLSNASIQSFNGDVTLNGRAFKSIIEVNDRRGEKAVGNITLNYAEACLISGHTVVIKHAVNCEIVAEHVEIGTVEGCSVVAKSVKIASSNVCRRREANIAMVLPNLSEFETKIGQVKKSIEKCERIVETKNQDLTKISAHPDVANYLTLAASIKKSGIKLNAVQQANFDKMATKFKFAKVDTSLARLNADKQDQFKLIKTFQEEISTLMDERQKAGNGVRCKIANVVGNTLVRIMPDTHDISNFQKLKSSDIKVKLRENGLEVERIFFNDEGSLDWEYSLPEIPQEATTA